jgi:hypothetical protein
LEFICLKLLQKDIADHRVIEALGCGRGTAEPSIDGMRINVLDSGDGSAAHTFNTHGGDTVNACLRSSEPMVKGVGGSTIGLTTGITAVTPSSPAFVSVESEADDLLGLPPFGTTEIGTGEKSAGPAIRHSVSSQL